jgi:hypothetical protein
LSWPTDDRLSALAWDAERKRREADVCPGCSGVLSETTAPEAEGTYEAQVVRCHRCKARNRAAQRLGDDADRSSLLIYTVKEPDDE